MTPRLRQFLRQLTFLTAASAAAFATEDRITFDLSTNSGAVDHKASGMLGGFNRAVPEDAFAQPLKLQTIRLSQSTQLPEESPFVLYNRAIGLGASKVILVVSDSVKCTEPDLTNWQNDWTTQVLALATQAANNGQNFVWDIFNEPDKKIGATSTTNCDGSTNTATMTMTDWNNWFSIWDQAYNAIRSVSPTAKITGPSYSTYSVTDLEAFIDHCAAANTMPDYINWHFGTITNYASCANTIRAYAATYGYTVGIIVGEAISSGTDRNLDPGAVVTLFANAERANINAVHASWTATPVAGIPQLFVPHFDGLVTPDTLLPRGAWWSYKSYGDMSGNMLTADLTSSTNLDGLASYDAAAHCAIALVGTKDKSSYAGGTGKVKFTNLLTGTGLIDSNGYTHVKVERIPLTEGELTALPVIFEGDCKPSTAGSLEVPFSVSSGREAVKITASLPTVASPSRPSPRIEGESLAATVISGRTVSNQSDSSSSGGSYSKAALGAAGDWVQYTFNVASTGTYWLNLGYKSDSSRGILQVSVDDVVLGTIDQSTNNIAYPDASVGLCTLSVGSHTLTFTVVGKSATSSGYTTSLDYYRLTPLNPIEAENLSATASAGDSVGKLTDSLASGGALALCNLNAVGDYVDFSVQVPAPGLYAVTSAYKAFTSRGIYQLSVDGVPEGDPVDGYSSSAAYKTAAHGFVTFTTAGTHTVRLTIVGKNSASTGYTIGADYFVLTPANLDLITQADVPAQSKITTVCAVSTSTATVSTVTEGNARGGAYSQVTLAEAGDTAAYTFNVPDAGNYFITVRYVTGPSGGQFDLTLDGQSVYSEIDTYTPSLGYVEAGIGTHLLTAGTHTLTFGAQGQASCSQGLTIGLDVIRASRVDQVNQLPTTVAEAESLTAWQWQVSNGTWGAIADTGASKGSYVDAALTNIGDSLTSPLNIVLPAGAYRLETGFMASPTGVRFTALVDNVTVGRTRTAVYNATNLFRNGTDPNTDFGSFIVPSAETPAFTFKYEPGLTSKGTTNDVDIDYIALTKYTRDR